MHPLHDVSLLATDFAPIASQADSFRAALVPHRRVLKDLELRTEGKDGHLEGLSTRRDDLRMLLEANEGLLAPIRGLAPEVLGEIFAQSVAMHNRQGRMIDDLPPLVFLRVCRRWRRVALGTPQLWNRLWFDEDLVEWNPFETLAMWMHSSGALPLDIRFHFPYFKSHHCIDGKATSPGVFQLVEPSLSRCRTLAFKGIYSLQVILPCERNDLLSLRSLRIDLSQDCTQTSLPWHGRINTPLLQKLYLNSPGRLLTAPIFSTQLENLSTVEISRWQPEPAEAVFLESCPALTLLTVRFHFPAKRSEMHLPNFTVHLPSLQEMHVAWMSHVDVTPFLDAIRAPSLHTLGLEQINRNGPSAFSPHMLSMFPNCPGNVTHLRLNSVCPSPEDLVWLSQKFTNIETLDLQDKAAFSTMMGTLSPLPHIPPYEWLYPNLTRLDLARLDLTSDASHKHPLIHFVEARTPCSRLRSGVGLHIGIEDCWVRSHEDQLALQTLGYARNGLIIEGSETLLLK